MTDPPWSVCVPLADLLVLLGVAEDGLQESQPDLEAVDVIRSIALAAGLDPDRVTPQYLRPHYCPGHQMNAPPWSEWSPWGLAVGVEPRSIHWWRRRYPECQICGFSVQDKQWTTVPDGQGVPLVQILDSGPMV